MSDGQDEKFDESTLKESTIKEIIDYYLDNRSSGVSKSASADLKRAEETKFINTKQRSTREGEKVFAEFLSDTLLYSFIIFYTFDFY